MPLSAPQPQALERRAAAPKGSGSDVGWSDGDLGHGKTFSLKILMVMIDLINDTDGMRRRWTRSLGAEKPGAALSGVRLECGRIHHFHGLAVDIKANLSSTECRRQQLVNDQRSRHVDELPRTS